MMIEIKEITKYLPEGWETAARETGALLRSRKIETAEDLLELNLLHLHRRGIVWDNGRDIKFCNRAGNWQTSGI